ncbi:MAG: hypothetical protein OXF56_23140 [Rhodobacteraceae bacterium]|nr:hypothetical protein [Paracoccaceae bacterium]
MTLGHTDGTLDKALTDTTSGSSIADNHTGHNPGYSGNTGLDGFTGNGGSTIRDDYTFGAITAAASAEPIEGDKSGGVTGDAFPADIIYDASA